jgi:hypothetical protein
MMGAPRPISDQQLTELYIAVTEIEEEPSL